MIVIHVSSFKTSHTRTNDHVYPNHRFHCLDPSTARHKCERLKPDPPFSANASSQFPVSLPLDDIHLLDETPPSYDTIAASHLGAPHLKSDINLDVTVIARCDVNSRGALGMFFSFDSVVFKYDASRRRVACSDVFTSPNDLTRRRRLGLDSGYRRWRR